MCRLSSSPWMMGVSHGGSIAHLAGDCILLYAIVHDANAVLFGRYDYSIVPVATCIFAIIHSFFLVQLRLDAQKRTDRAKSLIIHEDARIRNKLRDDLHDRLGQLTYGMEFLAESLLLSSSKDQKHYSPVTGCIAGYQQRDTEHA